MFTAFPGCILCEPLTKEYSRVMRNVLIIHRSRATGRHPVLSLYSPTTELSILSSRASFYIWFNFQISWASILKDRTRRMNDSSPDLPGKIFNHWEQLDLEFRLAKLAWQLPSWLTFSALAPSENSTSSWAGDYNLVHWLESTCVDVMKKGNL